MKNWLWQALQSWLGFERYLDLFGRFKLATFAWTAEGVDFHRFLSLIPDQGVVLDIGANVGFTTALLARQLRHGLVHAFEPSPANFRALERLVHRLGLRNVATHACALGNQEGSVEMVTPLAGTARLPGLTRVVRGRAETGERFTAPCRMLDRAPEWFPPGCKVVALKIDVEDYEFEVLDGARRLLAAHRPVILCELWDTENRGRCLALAAELGYSVRVGEGSGFVPFDTHRHRKLDFLLLPAG